MNNKRRIRIQIIISQLSNLTKDLRRLNIEEDIAYGSIPDNLLGSEQAENSELAMESMDNAIDYIDEAIKCLNDAIEELEDIE